MGFNGGGGGSNDDDHGAKSVRQADGEHHEHVPEFQREKRSTQSFASAANPVATIARCHDIALCGVMVALVYLKTWIGHGIGLQAPIGIR